MKPAEGGQNVRRRRTKQGEKSFDYKIIISRIFFSFLLRKKSTAKKRFLNNLQIPFGFLLRKKSTAKKGFSDNS